MVIPHSSTCISNNTSIGIDIGISTGISTGIRLRSICSSRIHISSIRIGQSTRRYLILSSIRKDIILLLFCIVQINTDSVFDSNTPL